MINNLSHDKTKESLFFMNIAKADEVLGKSLFREISRCP